MPLLHTVDLPTPLHSSPLFLQIPFIDLLLCIPLCTKNERQPFLSRSSQPGERKAAHEKKQQILGSAITENVQEPASGSVGWNIVLCTKKVAGSMPGQDTYLHKKVVGWIPNRYAYRRHTNLYFCLMDFLSLFL